MQCDPLSTSVFSHVDRATEEYFKQHPQNCPMTFCYRCQEHLAVLPYTDTGFIFTKLPMIKKRERWCNDLLQNNSASGCGNEEHINASYLKQEIVSIVYFAEINSTNSSWCKGVNLSIENNVQPQERDVCSVNLLLIRRWVAAAQHKAICQSTCEKGQLNNLHSQPFGAMTFSIMSSRKTKAPLSGSPEATEKPGNICGGLIMFSSETNKQKQIQKNFRRLLLLLS